MPTPSLPKMIAERLAAQKPHRWPLYNGGNLDRSAYLTASENMACLREVKFRKTMGDKQRSWGAAARGHAVEAWVVDQLEAALPDGAQLEFYGFLQRSFVDEKARLSGTPDGLLTIGKRRKTRYLIEIKSIDPRTNLESWDRPKPQHEAQVQQNMHLLDLAGMRVASALVFYIDASNFQRSRQFEVVYDPSAVERFKTRAALLFGAATPADLPAEGLTNSGCTWCAFTEECSAIQQANKQALPGTTPTPPKMPDFAPRGITDTIRELGEVKEERKSLEAREKTLSEKVKAYAQENNEVVLRTNRFTVEITEVAGRKTLDVAAYEKATGVPAEDYYKIGKPSLRLEIKPTEE